jgi:formamidopyrimidine-DNA glycosylase
MPELPDVEGFRRYFRRHAVGKPVRGVWADPDELRNTDPMRLRRQLAGRRFVRPRRHGKWLICPTTGPWLVLHFGMTGELHWLDQHIRHRHARLILQFPDGEMHFRDMRKLGGVWLAQGEDDLRQVLGPLGPDALRVSAEEFDRLLRARRGSAKATLMDQTFVAGLGNLTVDATLWRARIHPRRNVRTLAARERRALHREMKRVLEESLPHGLVPSRPDLLTASRRAGSHCPRCGTVLERATVAGRTSWFCPRCQR